MYTMAETPEDCEETNLKQRLLNDDTLPCVCCRLWEKCTIEGWQPKEEQTSSKKRLDTTKGGYHGSLRRERTIITASRGDFLFRHYESLDRYIQQYRENHSSTCMERDMNADMPRPVLGVDVPDPYLPKIASSSVLIERIMIIDALSNYYTTKRSLNSDVKDICLTGRKTKSTENKSVPLTPRTTTSTLPQIETANSNVVLPTVKENDAECTATEEKKGGKQPTLCGIFSERLRRYQDIRNIIRVTSNEKPRNMQNLAKSKKESLILPAAKLVCKDADKSRHEIVGTTFPQIPLWTEYQPRQQKIQSERVLETLRIGKKVKTSKESLTEELIEENLNLRSLETREGINSRGGNLCLGTTVRALTNQKEQHRTIKTNPTYLNKYLSDNSNLPFKKTNLHPRETTFIRILGHHKAPPTKDSNMVTKQDLNEDKAKIHQSVTKDYGIPLSYLRRFGRPHFHHVLEARSYKPETRKLGTAVIPN
ncbi:hypothetical protein QZH41_008251 [Actinostola sp. cb2023]|nr:hypothetical protein QZH41_008251 [Actinostola sp. cb2023]